MRVLLVRHAIAADRAAFSGPEPERPLTEEGVRRFRRIATALAAEVAELAVIATSPYARAAATADLLYHALAQEPALTRLDALAPVGKTKDLVAFLRSQARVPAVALVGHEPNLSQLEALLLTGNERPIGQLKKGGAALLDFAGAVAAGRAELVWQLTAAQLRRLGR